MANGSNSNGKNLLSTWLGPAAVALVCSGGVAYGVAKVKLDHVEQKAKAAEAKAKEVETEVNAKVTRIEDRERERAEDWGSVVSTLKTIQADIKEMKRDLRIERRHR